MLPENVLGIIISFAAAFCWGLVYAEVQSLDRTIPPAALLALFYVCCAAVTTPFVIFKIPAIARKVKLNYQSFALCVLATLFAEVLIFYSIQMLGGTDASLIEVSYPLWTALALYTAFRERPPKSTLIGGICIMAGVILIIIDKA